MFSNHLNTYKLFFCKIYNNFDGNSKYLNNFYFIDLFFVSTKSIQLYMLLKFYEFFVSSKTHVYKIWYYPIIFLLFHQYPK